jgi:DNA-binding NtrC family response regulator
MDHMTTKGSVLIVDDDQALANVLTTTLNAEGYEALSAYDGEQAIGVLCKRKFDLVLLDIKMPKVDGIEVLKFVQKNMPSVKVMMLTGFGDLKLAMQSKQYGAVDFLTKPYDHDEVLSKIEKFIRGT